MKNFTHIIKQYYTPIIIVLISKILILFFLPKLLTILLPDSRVVDLNFWESWNVWDAPHYISIAKSGYEKIGDAANFIVFLPFFPLLIFITGFIFGANFLIAGYIAVFIITLILSIMLYKLTLLDYSKKIARFAVLALFIFPTSFFLHIPYTESLFNLLSVATFYFVRKKRYWLGFLMIGFSTATKIGGLALIPAIFTELLFFDKQNFRQKNTTSKFGVLFFGFMISIVGFLIYLAINYLVWKDPFYFTFIQKTNWHMDFSPLGQGLRNAYLAIFWRIGIEKMMLGYGQIVAFIFGLVMSIYVVFRVRLSYGVFMLIFLWICYSMSYWMSMPRFILSLFPMYIALALFSENLFFRYLWVSVSTILLAILSLIFIQYGPVF